jgi:hypothetical protein
MACSLRSPLSIDEKPVDQSDSRLLNLVEETDDKVWISS